jgi:hypothetical protein
MPTQVGAPIRVCTPTQVGTVSFGVSADADCNMLIQPREEAGEVAPLNYAIRGAGIISRST